MGLFLNISSLNGSYSDCCSTNISETIEHDCLSVLHKLHDQVNGLQLVQVVVQPLAKFFSPANLAALAVTASQSSSSSNHNATNHTIQSNATTPSPQTGPGFHNFESEGLSTSTAISSSTSLGASNQNAHSRSTSFVSQFNSNSANTSNASNNSNSFLPTTSTYMMSPDTAQALIARLDTDRDVNWLMEIIGYGLSMPFSPTGEQDSVKDCCTIYCEWLTSALVPYNEQNEDTKYQQLSKLVPVPIRNDPNRYARKMLSHLYNVFLARQPNLSSSIGSQTSAKDQADAALTAVSRQAVLCHRVLRTLENIAQNPQNLMDDETWNHLLALLLTVNDKLLSPPTVQDDIGTQLHDRILGVLFELILLASSRSIPSASLWKTFHEMCLNWRHRPALIDHWKRITLILTKRVVYLSATPKANSHYGGDNSQAEKLPDNLKPLAANGAIESAVNSMSHETLSQTWYRFLNLIGNPVEFSDPDIISRTDEFYYSACSSDNVLDPRQHPCLNVLPQSFHNSMSALRMFVDTFLGTYEQSTEDRTSSELTTPDRQSYNPSARGSISSLSGQPFNLSMGSNPQVLPVPQSNQSQSTTPILSRRSAIKSLAIKSGKSSTQQNPQGNQTSDSSPVNEHSKSGSITSSRLQQQLTQQRPSLGSLSSRASQHDNSRFKFYQDRPKVNTILHVFGDWLFSAALIGSELNNEVSDHNDGNLSAGSLSNSTEIETDSKGRSPSLRRESNQTTFSQVSASTTRSRPQENPNITFESPLSSEAFELGQAEAMAILCKIFSSKSYQEEVSPTYLSRLYLCLQHCLLCRTGQDQKVTVKRHLLSSVLINSTCLLQSDLDGINLLIPSFINAIEFVFECNERELPIQPPPRQHNRSNSVRQSSISPSTDSDMRRACIRTLVNLLAYPNHFQDLVIRNCLNDSSPTTTFGLLRPRLLKLLFIALQTESDPTNMQILFGGLSLAIRDLAFDRTKSPSGSPSGHTKMSESGNSTGEDVSQNSMDATYPIKQEDTISRSSFVFNSTGGFLIKSLHVTCHLLINIWKHDTQVSLAALEILTTIARVSTSYSFISDGNGQPVNSVIISSSNNNNSITCEKNNHIEMRNEYMQTTKWICDYICNQCSRPPPAHSRDMHSTIVAAYQCLSVWFYNHPYLLNDQNCVFNLMEVIELGVSGQKSKTVLENSETGATNQNVISKDEKIMKPSSMRVREAAESLLNICIARDINMLTDGSNTFCDTMINELDLYQLFANPNRKGLYNATPGAFEIEAYRRFKYFSDLDSVIFAFLDNINQDPTTKDGVICLLRTPFGKHCWKMKFNYYSEKSREKIIANKAIGLVKKPYQYMSQTPETRLFPFNSGHNKSLYFNNSAKFFPDTSNNITLEGLDNLVNTLDEFIRTNKDPRIKADIERMSKIFDHQVMVEQKIIGDCTIRMRRIECEEPQQLNDLEIARLLTTHLCLKNSLTSLTKDHEISIDLMKDLRNLDRQPVRTYDAVSVFYVRRNKTHPKDILESSRSRHNVSLDYFEWLLELGHPTMIKNHNRWTGKLSNSWTNRPTLYQQSTIAAARDSMASLSRNQMLASDHGGAIFDGERMTLYWSDMCQEIAFVVPHRCEKNPNNMIQIGDTNIIICWLECHDDMPGLPCDTLLAISETGFLIDDKDNPEESCESLNKPRLRDQVKYFISPMRNGLYRVNLTTSFGRQWLALPLFDGMTVSKGILSSLIRESILNLCRRRRLDADCHQPPHVKRRLKIQEICNNYKISSGNDSTEFYHNLFRNKAN